MSDTYTTPIIWPVDVALECAAHGIAVYPSHVVLPNSGGCTCGDEHCPTPAAHAVFEGGEQFATTDADVIGYWWSRWPRAGVGTAH